MTSVQGVIVTDLAMVWTTIGEEQADELAQILVDERLAACVNVHAPMRSTYRWDGKVVSEPECQLVMKTTMDRLPALEARLREIHPYDLPELVIFRPDSADSAYAAWVRTETQSSGV